MLYVLITFWFLRELKHLLFWLYLWQLKEYHIGRFLNHFETHVGKKLLLDFSRFLKLGSFVFLLLDDFFIYVYYALFLIYFAEFISFVSGIRNKSLKKPVWTKKTFFLFWLCFLVLILFLSRIYLLPNRPQVLWILGFDILTPLIFSSVALFFQPASALLRNRVLRKAKEKMEKIRENYRELAKEFPNAHIVNSNREPKEIHKEIVFICESYGLGNTLQKLK